MSRKKSTVNTFSFIFQNKVGKMSTVSTSTNTGDEATGRVLYSRPIDPMRTANEQRKKARCDALGIYAMILFANGFLTFVMLIFYVGGDDLTDYTRRLGQNDPFFCDGSVPKLPNVSMHQFITSFPVAAKDQWYCDAVGVAMCGADHQTYGEKIRSMAIVGVGVLFFPLFMTVVPVAVVV